MTDEEAILKLKKYEENGLAKLYYALNRKAWEMADLLNATSLKNLSLEDAKDKTFERLKVIWTDSKTISETLKILAESAGITGDELKDVGNNPISPQSIAKTKNV